MYDIDLRTEISAAVALRWDDWASRHRALSRVIDQHLLVESALSALNRDVDTQRTLANARAVNASSVTVVKLIDKFVIRFMETLI